MTEVDGQDELRQRFQHIQRVARRESMLRMRHHDPAPPNFNPNNTELGNYSKAQLQKMEKCFLMADHDRDGKLNALELSYWLEKHCCPVSHLELAHVLRIADIDGDGALSFSEFVQFCKKIELEERGGGSEGSEDETFYDCLEFPYQLSNSDLPSLSNQHHQRPSLEQLKQHQQASRVHQVFEEQIRLCEEGKCGIEKDEAIFAQRVEEVRLAASGFDLLKLRGILHHPAEEIRCLCSHQEEKQQHFRTELFIVPQHGSHAKSVLANGAHCAEDDAHVIVPINASSSHKFDQLITDEEVPANLASDVAQAHPRPPIQKQNKGRKGSQDKYEHFYGTHPGPDLQEDFEGISLAESGWDKDRTHWD